MKPDILPDLRERRKSIQTKLLSWFQSEQRDLPWRQTKDPYKIWISEVMLQQTRVETVIPYWKRFVDCFPTVRDLAEANEDDVLKLWEGLGYYSRARNFQAAVREVYARYDGEIPREPETFSKLPGVGPYTTGAVLSISYNVELPAVDGNVFRVLSRIFLIEEDIAKPKTRSLFETVASALLPAGHAGDFNQALMELGATVCIPKSPRCEKCPVQSECGAYQEGLQSEFPVKGRKAPPREVSMLALLIEDLNGRYALRKRPADGLLANLWEFPTWEAEQETIDAFLIRFGYNPEQMEHSPEWFAHVEHIFSHLHWKVDLYKVRLLNDPVDENLNECQFVGLDEMERFSMSALHVKMKRLLGNLV